MRRRDFLGVLGGAAAAWPIAVRAQQTAGMSRRIGVMIIYPESNPTSRKIIAAFQHSLENLGWMVGRNLEIDYRWGVAEPEKAKAAAAQLLSLHPDLLLANSVAATRAAQQATRSVPIVFNGVSEPISLGFVTSLDHPGGNITGFTNLEPSVGGKWLELLKDIVPHLSRVAVMFNPASTAIAPQFVSAAAAAATRFGLTIVDDPVHEPNDIEAAMTALASKPGGALITLPDTFLGLHFKQIVDLELRWRLPAIHPFRYFVDAGSLMSYGPDLVDQFRQSAIYVDKIFRGKKPADLPVQQPTKFEFVINSKTANLLGLTVPQSILVAADEVIQ